jgi:hypothetical protein
MSKINWQQPFVNTFKHFTIASDKNAAKYGDVSTTMVNKKIKQFFKTLKNLQTIFRT